MFGFVVVRIVESHEKRSAIGDHESEGEADPG